MLIRPAEPRDIEGILEIYNESVLNSTATAEETPQTLETRRRWFNTHRAGGFPMYVAADDGVIAGWSSLSPFHVRVAYRYTVEDSIYLAPAYRGAGLGRQLLRPLIGDARRNGYHRIMALIVADNPASLRLHAELGFVEVGRGPELMFKFGQWLDLVWMCRKVDPLPESPG